MRVRHHHEAGYVYIDLCPDRRSDRELIKAREKAVAKRLRSNPLFSFCGTRPPNDPLCKVVLTDQFHFEDAVGVADGQWDEVREYSRKAR